MSEATAVVSNEEWSPDPALIKFLEQRVRKRLESYELIRNDVRDHHEIEVEALAGGYSYRQVLELVQNGADAILEQAAEGGGRNAGRIVLHLSECRLYAANTGAALTEEGIETLLSARSSSKRQNQIGRFGIGFKSLLGLGGKIDLFSRSVSLRFDPALCASTIREQLSLKPDYPAPGLRLAWPLDGASEFRIDAFLREYSAWATTVIRVDVANRALHGHIAEELSEFPAEFLLFLPADVELRLQGAELSRTVTRRTAGHSVILIENEKESPWQVEEVRVALTDPEARRDATSVHTREEVPISWARPLEAREERAGRFWAFFPTNTPSRIPGILNAPWKVNSDRTALIPGPYNHFLMAKTADLIVASLAPLSSKEDPGRPLDMFPRELESRDEVARPLVDAVWDRLSAVRVIPNGDGELRTAASLLLHPIEDEDAVAHWGRVAPAAQRAKFVHSTCCRAQRLTRLKSLLRRNEKAPGPASLKDWLEAIAATDLASAREVLRLTARLSELTDRAAREEIRQAKIIPAEPDLLVCATEAIVSEGVSIPGKHPVARSVASDSECCEILDRVLGIRPLDEAQWRNVIAEALRLAECAWGQMRQAKWVALWDCLRRAPENMALAFISAHSDRILLRGRDGQWTQARMLMRAGTIICASDKAAGILLDDEGFHAHDEKLLGSFGIQQEPKRELISWDAGLGGAYDTYRDEVRPIYYRGLTGSKNPQWSYLDFIGENKMLAGAQFLPLLSGESIEKLTALLLDRLSAGALETASFGHSSRSEVYPPEEVPSPTAWLLERFGAVNVAGHGVTIRDLIAASVIPVLAKLPGWSIWLRHAQEVLTPALRNWSRPAGDRRSLWLAVFASCEAEDVPAEIRRGSYEAAAEQGLVPGNVRTAQGLVPVQSCHVSTSEALGELALRAAVPVMVLSANAANVWMKHGAIDFSSVARIGHDAIVPEPLSLLDIAPELTPALAPDAAETAWVRACSNLRIEVGDRQTQLAAMFDGAVFFADLEQLNAKSWRERLSLLLQEASSAGWVVGDSGELFRDIVERNYIRRRADVAANAAIEERLLAAVGGAEKVLLTTFDDAVRRAAEKRQGISALDVARLALAVHGPTILSILQEQLEAEGLAPPRRWGTQESFAFATSLGFPREFGGSRAARRPAEYWATGPMPLGPLHDYQERLIQQLRGLITVHDTEPARAVLSLPTGSGKTRVAVETAVTTVLSGGTAVLWIAQTDELCEQAVQSFRQVWANRGEAWTDLRIVRLWGGNPNPVISDNEVPTVIVATIQTVVSRLGGTLPEWIGAARLVVIDEAHHAIAPSYTRLLNWLTGRGSDNGEIVPPPLLGLSATPFRGHNEDESRRLARRFHGRLFPDPDEQADLYQRLQAEGILSEILVEPLGYDRPFVLTEEEKKQIETFDEFPDAAAQRMSSDERRNNVIVRSVAGYAARGRVLLFANSVWHSSHLAALLHLKGIGAAAVHSGTEGSARQYFIREFQAGSIKVLCNYGVLTTGFDAPKTDVIVISRPVFSPVRYMQMVGRGLRGEKNGGTSMCRVVTVLDNIAEYSERLAYHTYFTPYFRSA